MTSELNLNSHLVPPIMCVHSPSYSPFSFSLLLKFPAVRAGSHDASRAWRRRCACSSALDSSRKIRFCCIWGICKLPALHIIGHACLLYFSQCFILPGLLFWLRTCRHACTSSKEARKQWQQESSLAFSTAQVLPHTDAAVTSCHHALHHSSTLKIHLIVNCIIISSAPQIE
jgi:hypothetical protein